MLLPCDIGLHVCLSMIGKERQCRNGFSINNNRDEACQIARRDGFTAKQDFGFGVDLFRSDPKGQPIAPLTMIQRRLKLGYARAARVVDSMEQAGIVSRGEGAKPREVLVGPEFLETLRGGS